MASQDLLAQISLCLRFIEWMPDSSRSRPAQNLIIDVVGLSSDSLEIFSAVTVDVVAESCRRGGRRGDGGRGGILPIDGGSSSKPAS